MFTMAITIDIYLNNTEIKADTQLTNTEAKAETEPLMLSDVLLYIT